MKRVKNDETLSNIADIENSKNTNVHNHHSNTQEHANMFSQLDIWTCVYVVPLFRKVISQ